MDEPPTSPIAEIRPKHYPVNWGPVSALVITIGSYFGAQLIAGLIISIYPFFYHWNKLQINNWLNHSTVVQFLFEIITEILIIGTIWWFLKQRRAKLSDIGLKKPQWIDIGYALIGFVVYFGIFLAVISLLKSHGLNTNQKQDLGFNTNVQGRALFLSFIALVIVPPLAEEISIRGFLYTGLRSKLPIVLAALLTSLLFGIAHLEIGTGQPLLWSVGTDTFILSLVLVYLRQKTDRLWAGILVHMIKNGIAFLSLFVFHLV